MAPAKGTSNNPRGVRRGDRNAAMTGREKAALDHENTGSRGKRIAAIVIRGRNAGW